jgi:hypothetical protein
MLEYQEIYNKLRTTSKVDSEIKEKSNNINKMSVKSSSFKTKMMLNCKMIK